MELTTVQENGVSILVAGGRLDAAGAPEIEAKGKALIAEGTPRLLIDMAGVDYVSSAGLRSLLVLAKAVKAGGGSMALCSLSATVSEVMTISGFDNILTLASDRAAAMNLLQ